MDELNLDDLRSVEELTNYQRDVRGRIAALNTEFAGLPFPEEQRDEFAKLTKADGDIDKRTKELRTRAAYIERMSESGSRTERVDDDLFRARPSAREQDIFDLSTIRSSVGSPEAAQSEMNDRAKRAIELARFPQTHDRAKAQEHVTNLLDEGAIVARRVLSTGSPVYNRAFFKALAGQPHTNEEARALSLTGAAGGFAVPFDLDPTIIPTSNGAINPIRQISRVVQTVHDEWRGVSSGAITTAYAAEATETTDNAPTLAQPTISTEKAQAFIPFSIEVGMDWPSLRSEMGTLLQDSKDELEAVKFTTGTGTNEPFGLLVGATTTVNATAAGVFDLEDLYRLSGQLPPRHRPNAAYMGNLDIYNKVRQFDTSGGAALWETLSFDRPSTLLGKPAYENSAMTSVTTVGALFLVYGNFSRYVIVDRVGLQVELIEHLVGTNHRPTGQRGLYAYWRNGAKVVDANAFRVLIGLA